MVKTKIREDLRKGLKEKNALRVSVLRLLLAAIFNKEKEKRYKLAKSQQLKEAELAKESELTDDEIIEVVSSEIKKRREAILEYERGKREDLAEKEKKEAEILKKYLPEQLSEEEIQKLVKEVINKIGAKELKDIGKVMKEVMPKVKGRAEGGLISQSIKKLLSKQE